MIVPSYTTKRTSGGKTDYLKLFKDRGILQRVRTCRGVTLCVPEQRAIPAGISLDNFTRKRRTVIQLPTGEQRELQDEWDVNQTRIQGMNGEQWQGFTDLYLQNTQEGLRPRRRINAKKSETQLKDEELQRKLNEEMQQGIVNRDMDFTPWDAGSLLKFWTSLVLTSSSTEESTLHGRTRFRTNHIRTSNVSISESQSLKQTIGISFLSGNMRNIFQQSCIIYSITSL